jgi:hypothetical protein
MNSPSLLYIDPDLRGEEVGAQVMTDIRLTSLLSESAVSVLRRPCGKDDILARREVFKYAETERGKNTLAELRRALVSLSHSSEFLSSARSDNERYAMFVGYARESAAFMSAAAQIESECLLLSRFSGHYMRIMNGQRFAELNDKLAAAEEALAQMGAFHVRVAASGSFLQRPDAYPPEAALLTERISVASRDIGIDIADDKPHSPKRLSTGFIDAIAKLWPDGFAALRSLYVSFRGLLTDEILEYLHELDYYIEVTALCDKMRAAGWPVAYPDVADTPQMNCVDARDISLLARGITDVVPNDIALEGSDAFCFLVGANGGGKTTYLRSLGSIALLFTGGAPVPARSAKIYPYKRVFTHFPQDERFEGTGRLLDETNRMEEIFAGASPDALVLLNETYSGTDERRADTLTREAAERLITAGVTGVFVTHFHGVEDTGVTILSAQIDEADNNRRLYKIVKRGAVRSSFAADILKKYGLTREALSKRLDTGKGGAV